MTNPGSSRLKEGRAPGTLQAFSWDVLDNWRCHISKGKISNSFKVTLLLHPSAKGIKSSLEEDNVIQNVYNLSYQSLILNKKQITRFTRILSQVIKIIKKIWYKQTYK